MIALLVRAWLTVHTHGVIDGDEALVGIQAEHILRGEYPVYYYAQPYMGSLEAYLIALLFTVTGPSVWALRAEPILLSLAIVWLTWRLAAALAGEAGLSPFARRCFMSIAALLAAIPPLYDGVLEMRTYGGYIETFVLMLLLLLSMLRLKQRWHAGTTRRELAWRWGGSGVIVGLGFWVNPLIITAIVAVALWMLGYCICECVAIQRRTSTGAHASIQTLVLDLYTSMVAIPGFLLGAAPAIIWGAHNHWANVLYVLQHSNKTLATMADLLQLYVTCAGPRAIGGALPHEDNLLAALHMLPLSIGICCTFSAVLLVGASWVWRRPLLLQMRRLVALPVLFGGFISVFFVVGSTPPISIAVGCGRDLIGRYTTPLALVLPFFCAAIFTVLLASVPGIGQRERASGTGERGGAGPASGREASKLRPYTFGLVRWLLWGLLAIMLVSQTLSYGMTHAALTFQSFACGEAPANNDAIIAYLQHEHVRYAWGITWVGNAITFKTNERIIVADPRVIMIRATNLGRIPAHMRAVEAADRPAMISLIQHGDPLPPLIRILHADHVTYQSALFPSEPGFDVLVVTSLSRTVSPLESHDFWKVFPYCSR
ncbi:MAG: hypothetical protein H0W02_14400 [Ktedonobacteraceae bacterium]|nr:hypothetical protein [Ktedonobacteraceae bacterium]